MSKITFRADDDLIAQLEEYDASKSEVMREALREYLGADDRQSSSSRAQAGSASKDEETIDEFIAERVDAIIEDRLGGVTPNRSPQDVNVNITLDGDSAVNTTDASHTSDRVSNDDTVSVSHDEQARKTDPGQRENADTSVHKTCAQCGEKLSDSHVYCPNCGEKSSRRVFCDCGDELRSDWGFCPGCGRRTPAADVLDQA